MAPESLLHEPVRLPAPVPILPSPSAPPSPSANAGPSANASAPGALAGPAGARPLHRLSTGIPRLDALMGGWSPGRPVLLYGPPFCGKSQLASHTVAAALAQGIPAVVLPNSLGAAEWAQRLAAIAADPHTLLSSPHLSLFESISAGEAARSAEAAIEVLPPRAGVGCLLVVESTSAILLESGPVEAFRQLRGLVGKTVRAGGVAILVLEQGMHTDAEVQAIKHLCTGMVELRRKDETHALHLEGIPTTPARPGWVEYEWAPDAFRIVGGFAQRRIR